MAKISLTQQVSLFSDSLLGWLDKDNVYELPKANYYLLSHRLDA